MIVLGGALAAFGFSGFEASWDLNTNFGTMQGNGWAAWGVSSKIEITVGVGLFLLGILLSNRTRE